MKYYCLYILILVFSSGCNDNKAKDLKALEDSLNRKEQELTLREKQLEIREQKLQKDTVTVKPDVLSTELLGKWSVKMTCTETTCPGYAVGDSKTEQWDISSDGGKVVAKAMDGNTPIRIYTGTYNGSTIDLQHIRPREASQPEIKMVVRLGVTNGTLIDGLREILRENECKVIYALQLEKM